MWTGAEEQNFLKVLRRYEQLRPGLHIENLGAVRDDSKTVRAIVAGVPPDLFTLAEPLYLGPMAANGALEPLDRLFQQSGLRESEFVPASLELCRYHGRLYAMPYLIDNQALLWNRRHFESAGLSPELPPATLEQLEDYAVRLTKRGADGSILQLGMAPVNADSFSAGDIFLLFSLFGGRLMDRGGSRISADDPANAAALAWYARLIERMGGYRRVSAFAAGFGQAQGGNNPFFMGKIAMMINGEWNPYWASKYAPELRYGVAAVPPPALRPQAAGSTWYGGNMICIPRGCRQLQQAWDLLLWMQSDEAQVMFASAMNNVPNRRTALHSPVLRQGAAYKTKFSRFLDLAESPNGGSFPAIPVANLYHTELLTALQFVLEGSKGPEQALKDVRIRVQLELDKYRQ